MDRHLPTDDSSPPSKRARISVEPSTETSDKHSNDYWFEDGNIVLNVERTLFRVHRGVIARYSSVFRDLFSLPQPPEGEIIVEGCVVIRLPGDTVVDWNIVFSIIYDHNTYYILHIDLDLETLSSILRLGKKYDIRTIYDAAVSRLRRILPTFFLEWVAITCDSPWPESFLHDNPALDLLRVVLDNGLERLLPSAYYLCVVSHSTEALFDSLPGTHDDAALSLEIIRKIVVGHQAIQRAVLKHKLPWALNSPKVLANEECSSETECDTFKSSVVDRCIRLPYQRLALAQLTDPFTKSVLGDFREHLCPSCVRQVESTFEDGQREIWDELPSYFGLPSWDDLKYA